MDCRVPFSDKSNWGVLESHGLFAIGAYLMKCRGNASGEDVAAQLLMIQLPRTQPRALHAGEAYVAEAVLRLVRELDIQIMDDGVQWEQSPIVPQRGAALSAGGAARGRGNRGISLPRSLPEKPGQWPWRTWPG